MKKHQLTTSELGINPPSRKEVDALYNWARELDLHLRRFKSSVFIDISNDNTKMEIMDVEPTADEIDDGQKVLYDTGSEVRIYTSIGNRLFYTTLTEVT